MDVLYKRDKFAAHHALALPGLAGKCRRCSTAVALEFPRGMPVARMVSLQLLAIAKLLFKTTTSAPASGGENL